MRLIDSNALMNFANNHKGKTIDANDIARFPTIDAVQAVRCGECKLHDHCTTEDVFKFARLTDNRRFCGIGERKDGAK